MNVRMLKTAAGPYGVYSAGEIVSVDEALGRGLVAAGAAAVVGGTPALPPVETAALETPERAVAPVQAARPSPRKRGGS